MSWNANWKIQESGSLMGPSFYQYNRSGMVPVFTINRFLKHEQGERKKVLLAFPKSQSKRSFNRSQVFQWSSDSLRIFSSQYFWLYLKCFPNFLTLTIIYTISEAPMIKGKIMGWQLIIPKGMVTQFVILSTNLCALLTCRQLSYLWCLMS